MLNSCTFIYTSSIQCQPFRGLLCHGRLVQSELGSPPVSCRIQAANGECSICAAVGQASHASDFRVERSAGTSKRLCLDIPLLPQAQQLNADGQSLQPGLTSPITSGAQGRHNVSACLGQVHHCCKIKGCPASDSSPAMSHMKGQGYASGNSGAAGQGQNLEP